MGAGEHTQVVKIVGNVVVFLPFIGAHGVREVAVSRELSHTPQNSDTVGALTGHPPYLARTLP